MGNVIDYLNWRGDLLLEAAPFSPVDALALSALSYVHLDGLVPDRPGRPVPLGRAVEEYLALPTEQRGRFRCKNDLELLKALAAAPRFAGMGLARCAGRFLPEEETQFAALAVTVGDGSACLAFRGTDSTLVGWKEDFNMSFMEVVPAQLAAAEFIQSFAQGFPGPLRLAGHSKGGNLAVAGASLCPVKVRDRVREIFSFDGPGFTSYLLARPGYQELRTRIQTFVPQSSVVGLLLTHEEPYTVVESVQTGLFQHDLYSWQVLGPGFVRLEEVTAGSRVIDRALKDWLSGLTNRERETVADTLYTLLSSGDARMVSEALEPQNLASALRAIKDTEPKDLLTLASSLARLAKSALRAWQRG